jgi:hypothetical protein
MKNPLADLYQQVLLNEAEKHNLQNPSSDEVGKLPKENIFDSKPKPVEGAEKAKLQKGPAYKETTGSSSAPKSSSSSFKGSAPAKQPKAEEGEEMEDTDVDPTEEEDEEETETKKPFKKEIKQENFTMSAFETLFKKTLTEEIDEVPAPEMESDEELNLDTEEGGEEEGMEEELEEEEEEEGDLVSDLRELQDKLTAILAKLEDVAGDEDEDEGDDAYTEDDFDDEFGDEEEGEEAAMKESMDKPKALNSSKGKALMSKKNKVGRLSAKGGKANSGSLKHEPKPKALGDKKGALQKGRPEVRSSVKKGDFIK